MLDKELLHSIISCDRDEINWVVHNGIFPAWDIAMKIIVSGYGMTNKQRSALQNVYTYYSTHGSSFEGDVSW
jgi:hypothetical protein